MFRLILHSLNKRRIQSGSIFFSVLVSVAVLFSLVLVYSGVTEGLQTSEDRLGADILVLPAEARSMLTDTELLFTGAPATVYMDEDVVSAIAQIDGVESVSVQFYGQTLEAGCCSTGTPSRLIGYDPETDWVIKPWADRAIGRELASDEVILGSSVDGFVDDTGSVLGQPVKVVAHLEETGTSLDNSILMNLDTVRAFSAQSEAYASYWEKYGATDTLISAVLVDVAEDQKGVVAGRIRRTGGGEWTCVTSSDTIAQIQSQMGVIFSLMFGVAMLLVLACVVQLFGRFYTMAWDRKTEMGLYRAMGASQTFLKKLIAGEAMSITLGGALVGIFAGVGLYHLIYNTMAASTAFPFLTPSAGTMVLYAAALFVLFGLFGMLAVALPMGQMKKIDPTLAMQRGDID